MFNLKPSDRDLLSHIAVSAVTVAVIRIGINRSDASRMAASNPHVMPSSFTRCSKCEIIKLVASPIFNHEASRAKPSSRPALQAPRYMKRQRMFRRLSIATQR